jgi:hypothetical protein
MQAANDRVLLWDERSAWDWQQAYERMQMLYECAQMRYRASEALLALAEKELGRIKGV